MLNQDKIKQNHFLQFKDIENKSFNNFHDTLNVRLTSLYRRSVIDFDTFCPIKLTTYFNRHVIRNVS